MDMFLDKDFWKNYMVCWWGEDLIQKAEVIEEIWLPSSGQNIHLEVYDTKRKTPTIIFLHGLVGYARLVLPFTSPLFELGYNVIAPDLMGYGKTTGLKGDFTWNDWMNNVRDTVEYAKKRFGGPVILSGASMGGPVAFSAASRFKNVDSVICYCLWDLQRREFIEGVIKFGKWSYFVLEILKIIALFFPKIRFKNSTLINYNNLTDSIELNKMLESGDPNASTLISIRAAVSMITQSKWDTPLEEFNIPLLIFQPSADRMTPPFFAREIYERLKGKKRWIDFTGADHMTSKQHYFKEIWALEVDRWLKELFK